MSRTATGTKLAGRSDDAQIRADARELYLQSATEGSPLTGAELGELFGRTDRWGRLQIAAVRAESQASREGERKAKRQRNRSDSSAHTSSDRRRKVQPDGARAERLARRERSQSSTRRNGQASMSVPGRSARNTSELDAHRPAAATAKTHQTTPSSPATTRTAEATTTPDDAREHMLVSDNDAALISPSDQHMSAEDDMRQGDASLPVRDVAGVHIAVPSTATAGMAPLDHRQHTVAMPSANVPKPPLRNGAERSHPAESSFRSNEPAHGPAVAPAEHDAERAPNPEEPAGRPERSIAATLAVLMVAIVAAVASYDHQRLLAEQAGEDWRAWLWPLSVDGLVIAASMSSLAHKRAGRRPGPLVVVSFLAGIGVSVTANVAAAEPTLVGRLVAAWPPLALLLAWELLGRAPRHPAPETGRPRR